MPTLFDYVPHPHVEKRRETGPPKVASAVAQIHGPGQIGRINAKVGLKITLIVGTMWCAYLFTLLALVSAPSAFKTGNSIIVVAYAIERFFGLRGKKILPPKLLIAVRMTFASGDGCC